MAAEGRGTTLAEALHDLADFWLSRPSLINHEYGVVTLRIAIGNRETAIELVDPILLDQMLDRDVSALVDYLAKAMGTTADECSSILASASGIVTTVDRLRIPNDPVAWTASPDLAPDAVLPDATLDWVRDLIAAAVTTKRVEQGKELVSLGVRLGVGRKMSDTEISSRLGVPRTTVRDKRIAIEQEDKGIVRKKRYTKSDEDKMLSAIDNAGGNVAAAARQLGIAASTLRDARERNRRKIRKGVRKAKRHMPGTVYAPEVRTALANLVKSGMTATEAGRKLGVAGRTARGWVK